MKSDTNAIEDSVERLGPEHVQEQKKTPAIADCLTDKGELVKTRFSPCLGLYRRSKQESVQVESEHTSCLDGKLTPFPQKSDC